MRHDGVDKVTGRAIYGADVHMTGMVYGRMLRSPHAHARIKSIDASAASEAAGRAGGGDGQGFPEPEETRWPTWAKAR